MKNKSLKIKISIFVLGIVIVFSIFFINRLIINNIRKESRIQVEKIALAYSDVIHKEAGDIPNFLNIFLPTINFPLIITFNNEFYGHNNHQIFSENDDKKLKNIISDFINKSQNKFPPLPIMFDDVEMGKIHYGDPKIIYQLKWLPYFEIGFLLIFLFFSFWGFQIIRTSEKNYIWAGMSRETAHQLGTPITSLFGWLKLLEDNSIEKKQVYKAIEEDVNRLSEISDRFYKIGTSPTLSKNNIVEIFNNIKIYLLNRVPRNSNINIKLNYEYDMYIMADSILLNWAFENIIKNSLDATNYKNSIIEINFTKTNKLIIIHINDNGKGINGKRWNKIFKPGYSTKKRGWGLGLSLSKRIIEDLHQGKLDVISSKPGSTELRIEFKK